MTKGKRETRWDVYTWVGCGDVKLRLSNVPLKEAKKAKAKWIGKSPKHGALIAAHKDKAILKGLMKSAKPNSSSKGAKKKKK